MLEAVGMNEINKIFAVTDAMGIHREAVVIPLGTGKGRVRKLLERQARDRRRRRDAHRRVAQGPAGLDPGRHGP